MYPSGYHRGIFKAATIKNVADGVEKDMGIDHSQEGKGMSREGVPW